MKGFLIKILPILLFALVDGRNILLGQEGYQFNYNIENGLPTNHIYGAKCDKLGYLWAFTPAGVVKYNGYEFKLFTTSNGLPTDDIWCGVEDKKGKIWLGSISEEIGYLYNNKYHSVDIGTNGRTIYPRYMQKAGDGIIFYTYTFTNKHTSLLLAIDNNISKSFCIEETKFAKNKSTESPYDEKTIFSPVITNKNDSLIIFNPNIYRFSISGNSLTTKYIRTFDKIQITNNPDTLVFVIDDYLIKINKYHLKYQDLITGKGDSIIFDNSKLLNKQSKKTSYLVGKNDTFYYTIGNSIYSFYKENNNVKFIKKYRIGQLIPDSTITANAITTLSENYLWGLFVGTNSTGLTLNYHLKRNFKKEKHLDLKNFKLFGLQPDKTSLWWNSYGTLATINHQKQVTYTTFKNYNKFFEIVHYKNDSFIAVSPSGSWVVKNNGKWDLINKIPFNIKAQKLLIGKDSTFYILTSSNFTIQKFLKGKMYPKTISDTRYKDLVYDKKRKMYWAYSTHSICINSEEKNFLYDKKKLDSLGIGGIEKIAIDSAYGNIFILQNTISGHKLFLYDYEKNTCINLLKNFNLRQSKMFIHDSILIIAGASGLIFSKVTGVGAISAPVCYRNYRNYHYNQLNDAVALGNEVIINTDKGVYSAEIPKSYKNVDANENERYNFITYYKDTSFQLSGNDSLILDQRNTQIQFDIINPFGVGKVRYKYRLEGESAWHEINSNELTLPSQFNPGKYYTISLEAEDDVWSSNITALHVYIQPYWWQMLLKNKWFWIAVSVVVLSIIFLLIFLTRKIVNKNNLKRNLRQEMEIKSVHSQINPHFIFNTLNTALYFIKKGKMDEAYQHVSKFSWLLRAYIKSSRNKYISIAEEIVNLNNYIQLQQSRFEDKFDYEIILAEEIDASQTKIPALLLQPIVENAIDHGLFHKTSPGHLKIEFKKISLSTEIQCIIEDNGIGRKKSKLISTNSLVKQESYGDSLIKDLVDIFNRYEKTGIVIDYFDKQLPDTGTTVMIRIKNPVYEK